MGKAGRKLPKKRRKRNYEGKGEAFEDRTRSRRYKDRSKVMTCYVFEMQRKVGRENKGRHLRKEKQKYEKQPE